MGLQVGSNFMIVRARHRASEQSQTGTAACVLAYAKKRRAKVAPNTRSCQWMVRTAVFDNLRYRLKPTLRASLIQQISAAQIKQVGADHPAIAAWKAQQSRLPDFNLVNVAKAHNVRVWTWLWLVLLRNAFQSVDVFEWAVNNTLIHLQPNDDQLDGTAVVQMIGRLLKLTAILCRDWRVANLPSEVSILNLQHLAALYAAPGRLHRLRTSTWVQWDWWNLSFRALTVTACIVAVAWPTLGATNDHGHHIVEAALSAASVVEVRTAGNDTNGAGFVTGAAGTDYSQQNSKNTVGADISTTDAVAAGTTTLTSITGNFGTTIVGNIIYLAGGTGAITGQWRQITARASTTSITMDAAIAASTGMTMNIGGALLSPGLTSGYGLISGGKIWVKAGTYSVTSASTSIAAGCFSSAVAITVEGYNATRGDLGTRPLVQASGISTFTLFTMATSNSQITNIRCDGATLTSSRGFAWRGNVMLCSGDNCTNGGFALSTITTQTRCTATGCSTVAAMTVGTALGCVVYDNTFTAIVLGASHGCGVFCIADSNSGASSDGFSPVASGTFALNSAAYNNGRDGFRAGAGLAWTFNFIAEANAGIGFNGNAQVNIQSPSCASYNNGTPSSGYTGAVSVAPTLITGSGSFFTDAPNQDFSLNNTAGAGAALRAAGFPGVLPIGGTGYQDIGPLQHQDSGGGSTFVGIIGG